MYWRHEQIRTCVTFSKKKSRQWTSIISTDLKLRKMDDGIELNPRIDEISHSDSDELSLLPDSHNQSNPWLEDDQSNQAVLSNFAFSLQFSNYSILFDFRLILLS